MKILFFFIMLTTLSACSYYTAGNMTGNASLQNANFRNVGLATGSASASYFLFFGDLNSDGLLMDAKKNLYANTAIQSGQALANITVDTKTTFFILGFERKVTITADVIDFNTPSDTVTFKNLPYLTINENSRPHH